MFFSSTTKRQNKVKFCFLFGGPIQPLDLFAFHLDLKRIWNIQWIFIHAFIHKQYWVISTICRPSFSRSQVKSIFLYSSLGGTQWVDIVHWTIHYRGSDFCLVGHIGAVVQSCTCSPKYHFRQLSRTLASFADKDKKMRKLRCFSIYVVSESGRGSWDVRAQSHLSLCPPHCEEAIMWKTPQKEF